uniref:Putative transcriptional coactivator caper rrm superfamily n=1 Tax=Ixodes ricinus TaxID=34613 RepID=V5I4Z4_IXORI
MELEEEEAAVREEEGAAGSAECRESGQGDVPQEDGGKKGSAEDSVPRWDPSRKSEEEKRRSGKEAGRDRREDKREGGKTSSDRKPATRTDRSHERSSGSSTRKAAPRSEPRKAETPRRTESRRSEPRKPEPRRLEPKRDVDSWREPRLPRADPPRADPPRDLKRRAPEPDTRSAAAKRGKFNCFVCKLVLYSEKEYREHFNSRGHLYEVSRKEQKETRPAPKRGRSPPPFASQPHQRSRSPPAASSAGRWRRERDPSPRPFAESSNSRSTPRQPLRTDLFSTPQQPMRDAFGATQQPVHDVFGAPLPQAGAVLENYTERRDAPDPAVAATLENMILLQQQLLAMTANAPPALQRTISQGLQQGLQQVVQPALQQSYQQQTAQQTSYGSVDYSQQRSAALSTQVPDLQQSLMQLRQSQQYSVLNSYQQQHQMANATSNVAASYLNSVAGQHATTGQLGSVSQYGNTSQQASIGQQRNVAQHGSVAQPGSVAQHTSVSQHRGVGQRGATSQQGGVGQHERTALSSYQSSTVDGSIGSYTMRRKGAAVQPLKKSGGAFQQSPATRQGQAPASSLGYGGASVSDGRRGAQGTLGQYARSNLTTVRSSGFNNSLAKRY